MEFKSKTEKKKEALILQEIGVKLTKLSSDQLERIDMPQEMRDAVDHAKSITSHGGLRRQMQYIGTLMRNIDAEDIQKAIKSVDEIHSGNTEILKELERQRDELIGGNASLVEEILDKYTETDRQQFTQLIRNAKKEVAAKRPPKAYRALFKYLKKITQG